MASPGMLYDAKARGHAIQTRSRLEECWKLDFNWGLYPRRLQEGCEQVGKAMSMPPAAVLSGVISLVAFFLSHSVVEVEGTDWVEPVLLWISIGMPTGSGKSPLFKYLLTLIQRARQQCGLDVSKPGWLLEDATFEKMGDLMSENYGKLMGLYDELSTFLTQMNLYRGKGLAESHDLALFLQLYNGTPWVRRTVSGDANFSMDVTALTIGGFTQPTVARSLIELQASVEKGLCPRFLWVFPKPIYGQFHSLEKVDKTFTDSLVSLMSSLWNPRPTVGKWKIPNPFPCYQKRYDEVQVQLEKLSGLDELLSGMLSKSKGQILRVAAVLHALFHMDKPDNIPSAISEEAMTAADNFVSVCLQHAAYIAGRGLIEEAIQQAEAGQVDSGAPQDQAKANGSLCLTLPGKSLHLTALLSLRKFRKRGDKEGALAGFHVLEKVQLGKVEATNPKRGTSAVYKFVKAPVPTSQEELVEFSGKLFEFGVSLNEYKEAIQLPDITMESIEAERQSRKRASAEVVVQQRKSPRRNLAQQLALAEQEED